MGQDNEILIAQVQAILLNEKLSLNVESPFLKNSLLHDTCVLKNLSGPSASSSHIHTCKIKKVSENVIKFVFYFLRCVHRFCLFVDFIERLMLLFIIVIIKLCYSLQ